MGQLLYFGFPILDLTYLTQLLSQFMQALRRTQWLSQLYSTQCMSLVSKKMKKQKTMSGSFTEIEYRSVASTTYEVSNRASFAGLLHCDNKTTQQHRAANLIFYERMKHLEINCHIVHNLISYGFLRTMHVGSKQLLVDLFITPLEVLTFIFYCPRWILEVFSIFILRMGFILKMG
ncbi:hypothetical protein MANES_12G076851v8 [Manihot esculenta]|uniref:Uncharacterized protein n=1 Tax=Manihot esculenta TaxID=3983 RepID=A0ACB7GRM3_MANES|nr:hypothetical protein MANES_12G076851v8 [Manihot esculenta]